MTENHQVVVNQPGGRAAARKAHRDGTLVLQWMNDPLQWAKEQGWPTPFFGLKMGIMTKMFESDESFRIAARAIDVYVPKHMYDSTSQSFPTDRA